MRRTARGTSAASSPTALGPSRRARTPRVNRWLVLWAGGAVCILGLFGYVLFAAGWLGGSQAAADLAPDLTFSTPNGEFRLSEQRGKVVVLYFSFPG